MDINEIKKRINKHWDILESQFYVRKLGIFGSYARGESNELSDIDIVVEFSQPVGFFEFIQLEDFLSDKLGISVDLVTKKGLKRAIKKDIIKETLYV